LHNRIATRTQSGDRIVAVPVTADESVVGVIRGAQPTSQTDARTIRIAALLGAIACGVVGVGAVIGFVVAGRLARPVRRLRDAAVQLGDGDFTVEIPRSKVPELDEAADALVVTSQRLHDLVARERSFTADASHQLRTPLAGLRAAIETELSFPRPDPSELLHEALDDIARLERTIGELLTIARAPDSRPSTCLLVDVERALALSWHGRYAAVGRRLTFANADDVPPVRGSGAVLRHVLDVLLDNALVHGAGHTRVDHAIGTESVTLTVGDEGEGWAPAPRLDGAEEGATPRAERPHGLGLPLARRLIETMPGRLVIARSGRHPRIDLVVGLAEPSVARPRDAADVRPVVV
ncbi:MAG: two-component system histidine kinase, partial [Ilumatobacteraceae bacterium]|nr:two-component system histidine kinase [Ilumatobacteraceae bacterium]